MERGRRRYIGSSFRSILNSPVNWHSKAGITIPTWVANDGFRSHDKWQDFHRPKTVLKSEMENLKGGKKNFNTNMHVSMHKS